jgi:hypothetical protein
MSDPSSSSTGIVTHAQQSEVGGTSFLDLPLELREMVYDLCAPKKVKGCFQMPFKSEPVVIGVTLLRCSKQIYTEVSPRLQLWDSTWKLDLRSRANLMAATTHIDCSLAMSSLHDLALAKIKHLSIRFRLDDSTPATLRISGLGFLLKLTSLRGLFVDLDVGVSLNKTSLTTEGPSDPENLAFLIGFMIRVLSYVPISAAYVGWYVYYPGMPKGGNKTWQKILLQYESVRGSAYRPQDDSDSSKTRQRLGKSMHIGSSPESVLTATDMMSDDYSPSYITSPAQDGSDLL